MKREEILSLLEEDMLEEEQNIILTKKGLIDIGRLGGIAPRRDIDLFKVKVSK